MEKIDTIVLAGGKGTRLQGVVSDRPKPLAEVAGRPFVEWLLLFLREKGIGRVILATGYKGEMVREHLGDGANLGMELSYSHETVPLGTGGAACHGMRQGQGERLLILNGDSFCPFDIRRLLATHERLRAPATLWLVEMDDCRRYGAVDVEPDGRVVAFHEKSPGLRAGTINAGIYLFERSVLAEIPGNRSVSLETDVFPTLISRGLAATVGPGPFLDIGTPESYHTAESFIAGNRSLWHAVL